MQHWSLRDAKDHLSRLVEAAKAASQAITKRGREAAIVVSWEEYDRLLSRREPLSAWV